MARPAAAPELSVLEVAGAPRAMGRAQGEHWREGVREVCEVRLAATLRFAAERGRDWTREALLAAMAQFVDLHAHWRPRVTEEFLGIADGAGVTPAELMVGNGLTDIRDSVTFGLPSLEGCTTFTALPAATADGAVYAGQTWDMDQAVLPHVYLCHRRPDYGPATLSVTTCGCLSLIGVNEAGLAIGNSNVSPHDAKPGIIYLALIHEALGQTSMPLAVSAVSDAPRASGHHYYFADARGAMHLETTATRWADLPRDGACHTQSNDYRWAGFQALADPPTPEGRSIERRCALADELAARQPLDLAGMQAALAAPGVAVREPVRDTVTCAAVVMRPESGELWATHGPPGPDGWRRYAV